MNFSTDLLRDLYWQRPGGMVEDLRLVAKNHLGEWRWGVIYQLVFERAEEDGTWAVDVRESSGDDGYISFDDYGDSMEAYRVRAEVVQTTNWVKV